MINAWAMIDAQRRTDPEWPQDWQVRKGWGYPPREDKMHYYEPFTSVSICGYPGRPRAILPDGNWQDRCNDCLEILNTSTAKIHN
jgi:hypothetical protein